MLALGRFLGLIPRFFQSYKRKYFRVKSFRIIFRSSGIINTAIQKKLNYFVNNIGVAKRAIAGKPNNHARPGSLCRLVKSIQYVFFAPTETRNSALFCDLFHSLVLCFVSGRDNYFLNQLSVFNTLDLMSEHWLPKYQLLNLPRSAR